MLFQKGGRENTLRTCVIPLFCMNVVSFTIKYEVFEMRKDWRVAVPRRRRLRGATDGSLGVSLCTMPLTSSWLLSPSKNSEVRQLRAKWTIRTAFPKMCHAADYLLVPKSYGRE